MIRRHWIWTGCFLLLAGCQQATLVEDNREGSRSDGQEQSDSTATVTPAINQGEWEGEDNVDFDFGEGA